MNAQDRYNSERYLDMTCSLPFTLYPFGRRRGSNRKKLDQMRTLPKDDERTEI